MAKSNEPIFWSLFAAGGMVAAMLLPITAVFTSLFVITGWLSAEEMQSWIVSPWGRIYIFLLVFLPLFHAAHRLRITLKEMGVNADNLVAGVCYGGAATGTFAAAWVLTVGLGWQGICCC